ncbi:MAG: M48 family metalloprotease, partial [bacterium]|nr:M48 family metalloprotease [bacterium]
YKAPEEYLILVRGVDPEKVLELCKPYLDSLYELGWYSLGGTLLLVVAALFVAVDAVYIPIQTRAWLQRLQTQREEEHDEQDGAGAYRAAVGGGSLLRRFRAAFGAVWLLLSGLLMAALGYAVLCAFQAVVPTFPHYRLRLAELCAEVINYLFGLPHGDWRTHLAVRSVWVLYGLTAAALLAFSVVQLLRARRFERRRLLAAPPAASDCRHQAARATLKDLARRAELGEVRLAVLPEQRPYAASQCFGVRGRERFVIVSEGALRDFGDLELRSLLAHELAHLRLGHCRKVAWWRWLGRLTFAGDGFVLALQNSFGFEEEADRHVLEHSWAPATALEKCLVTLRHAAAAWQDEGLLAFGPAARTEDENRLREDERIVLAGGPLALPPARRWRLAWWLFRRQYLAAMELHYWHPTYQERLKAVRGWRAEHET